MTPISVWLNKSNIKSVSSYSLDSYSDKFCILSITHINNVITPRGGFVPSTLPIKSILSSWCTAFAKFSSENDFTFLIIQFLADLIPIAAIPFAKLTELSKSTALETCKFSIEEFSTHPEIIFRTYGSYDNGNLPLIGTSNVNFNLLSSSVIIFVMVL